MASPPNACAAPEPGHPPTQQQPVPGALDVPTVLEFLKLARPDGGPLMLLHIPATNGPPVARTFNIRPWCEGAVGWEGHADALLDWVAQYTAEGHGVYWLPNETSLTSKKPKKEDMTRALFTWADCDPDISQYGTYDAARAHLLNQHALYLQRIATFVIDSGNGLQALFRLRASLDLPEGLAQYEWLNSALGVALRGDRATFNADRVLRVPGTWNWPTPTKLKKGYPDKPRLSRILSSTGDRIFGLDELARIAEVDECPPAQAPNGAHAPATANGSVPPNGHGTTYAPLTTAMSTVVSAEAVRRFDALLNANRRVARRWAGDTTGLSDASGSGFDMSMYKMLATCGFGHGDIVAIMLPWQHGSIAGRAQGDRYWTRMRDKTVAACSANSTASGDINDYHGNHADSAGAEPVPLDAHTDDARKTGVVGMDNPVEAAIDRLNSIHAYVLVGGSGVVMKKHTDGPPDFLHMSAFHGYYANQLVPVQTKNKDGSVTERMVPASKLWMSARRRRTYDGVEFSPGSERPGYYNLWQGFSVEPFANMGVFRSGLRCRRLLSHIKNNVCEGDRAVFHYFIRWCADLIQRPNEKSGIAVSISGRKGTGKSKVIESLSALLGPHAITISQRDQLTGRFNAHHAQALLVCGEEAFWAGDKQAEGALKNMVTNPMIALEKKGVDIAVIRSPARYLFVGNAEWLFPATDDERRLFALTCGEAHRKDFPYFRAIDDQLYGCGKEGHAPGQASYGLRAWLTFLMRVDLTGFEIRNVPDTKGLKVQRAATLEPHEQFLLDCVNGQEICGLKWGDHDLTVNKRALYESFIERQRARGRANLVSESAFGKTVRKVFGWGKTQPHGQPRQWVISPWPAAVDALRVNLGVDIDPDSQAEYDRLKDR
jgi:hypothetical protein